MQVIVTSANLKRGEMARYVQAVWWQDFPRKVCRRQLMRCKQCSESSQCSCVSLQDAASRKSSGFEVQLQRYFDKLAIPGEAVDSMQALVCEHDFSSARAALVSIAVSVPLEQLRCSLQKA